MKRTAKCEFYGKKCDNTIYNWNFNYEGLPKYEHNIDETNWRDSEDSILGDEIRTGNRDRFAIYGENSVML
jgi:hypothetical protein